MRRTAVVTLLPSLTSSTRKDARVVYILCQRAKTQLCVLLCCGAHQDFRRSNERFENVRDPLTGSCPFAPFYYRVNHTLYKEQEAYLLSKHIHTGFGIYRIARILTVTSHHIDTPSCPPPPRPPVFYGLYVATILSALPNVTVTLPPFPVSPLFPVHGYSNGTPSSRFSRNLPFKISADEMYDIFGKYGAIRQVCVWVRARDHVFFCFCFSRPANAARHWWRGRCCGVAVVVAGGGVLSHISSPTRDLARGHKTKPAQNDAVSPTVDPPTRTHASTRTTGDPIEPFYRTAERMHCIALNTYFFQRHP